MKSTNAQSSKTVWLGLIGVIIAVLGDPAIVALIPLEWYPRILAVSAALGIIMRYYTSTPITGTGAEAAIEKAVRREVVKAIETGDLPEVQPASGSQP